MSCIKVIMWILEREKNMGFVRRSETTNLDNLKHTKLSYSEGSK